jgi:hypothetical protein
MDSPSKFTPLVSREKVDVHGALTSQVSDGWQHFELNVPLHVKALASFFAFDRHTLGHLPQKAGADLIDFVTASTSRKLSKYCLTNNFNYNFIISASQASPLPLASPRLACAAFFSPINFNLSLSEFTAGQAGNSSRTEASRASPERQAAAAGIEESAPELAGITEMSRPAQAPRRMVAECRRASA